MRPLTRSLLVIGASSVALEVADIAHEMGRRIEVLLDETAVSESGLPGTNFRVTNSLTPWIDDDRLDVVIAIGDNFWRESVYERLRPRVRTERFVNVIHPGATVSHYAHLGMGSIVLAGCRIGPNATVGNFPYLNANTVVAHDCIIGDYVSMGAGATLAGRVEVGKRSSLGLNSSVRERCVISNDVIVGANGFVNFDTPPTCILGGVPAKVLRERTPGERYLR